jgi:large subunit ribosomal protein L10
MTAHIAAWKKEAVDELASRIAKSKVVGVIDVHGVPAPAFQTMRTNLRGKADIVMLKNTLLKIALAEAGKKKKGVEKLVDAVDGQCAIVTSDLNPFRLFRQLDATKTRMPARGGETAPDDIEVKAGDTPFKPGPIVGDLQKAGLPAAIEQGKVVIKKDKVLVKKGDKIPREVALVLGKLEIFPLMIGLDLHAVLEDGMIYKKDVLAVDDEAYRTMFQRAAIGALNLSVYAAYPTKQSIRLLLSKAHMDSLNLAVNADIANKDTIKLMLAKANAQMLSVASKVPAALDDDLKNALSNATKPSSGGAGGSQPKREEKKEEKKEEKVSEDQAAAGLGALFG